MGYPFFLSETGADLIPQAQTLQSNIQSIYVASWLG